MNCPSQQRRISGFTLRPAFGFRLSAFGIRPSFGFRFSGFGFHLRSLLSGLIVALAFQPDLLWACAACAGQSDSPMAKGMNWGIFSLLAVVVFVLGAIASFFVYLAKRSATLPDNPAPGASLESTRKSELTVAECISPAGLLISVSTQEG